MSLWSKIRSLGENEFKRSACHIDQTTVDLLASYLQAERPTKKTFLKDTQLIAVDFETSGLNANTDEILSMGFCPIQNSSIRLAECLHILVKPSQTLKSDNVIIHGLTDDHVCQGISPEKALQIFLEQTNGKVIIAHFHSIEKTFIHQLSKQVIGRTLPLSLLDTCRIAHQRMLRRNQVVSSGSLRLFNLRKEFGLPNYHAHNALEDAISTAELFLAQLATFNMSAAQIQLKNLGLINYQR